jgi:acetyl-CoA C-acetyltransferase
MANQSLIFYRGRTPIGKLSGAFANTPAPLLGATLVKDLLKSTALSGDDVDEVIMGTVLPAGQGQAPARQSALLGGLPKSACATTVNRVCGSGIKAIMLADQAIRLGDANLILAGGQENMTLAPHLLMNSRAGYRFGAVEAKDHMQWDGLWDPYDNVAMGNCGEICANEYKFSRDAQDQYAISSYEKARNAIESGHFTKEIVPVEIKQKHETLLIEQDEEPFSINIERLKTLRPAFEKEGTITAGNASSINDGAALVGLCNEKFGTQKGLKPLARIIAQASHAQEPKWFTTAPIACIEKVLQKAGLKKDDIDLFEINEAFAVVPMAAIKTLGLDPDRVNVHGGAVSLGHPIGCSGTRIVVTLLNALEASGGKRGLATLCIGGGEASAIIVERL